MSAAIESAIRDVGHRFDGAPAPVDPDRVVTRHDPATGRLVARVAAGSVQDADRAVAAARRAFDEGDWPRRPGAERAAVLRRFAALVAADADALAELDSEEVGKPLRFARADVAGAVANIEYAASLAHTLHGESWTDYDPDVIAYTVHEPAGVAALIIPWNFPALILSQKLPFALAAGCTTVIKPSELTSSSAARMVELAIEAGVPSGAVNLVTGLGADVGARLVEHPDVDVISFTGSTVTGRAVARAAADTVKRVGLELGGKAANVVFADADLDEAAESTVFAAFFNQGECCVAGARLLVQRDVQEAFLERVVALTERLVTGAPTDPASDIGPLIHATHLSKVITYVEEARRAGARIVTGGARPATAPQDGSGHYLAPTIIADVGADAPIFQQEVFGPVLTVTAFDDAEDAIRLANATSYGLSHALWTTDLATAHRVARRLRSGTVWVNTNVDGTPAIAFGGMKASGVGREVGREGLAEFLELKSVQVRTARRGLSLVQAPPAA